MSRKSKCNLSGYQNWHEQLSFPNSARMSHLIKWASESVIPEKFGDNRNQN